MASSVIFNAETIPGTVMSFEVPPRDVVVRRTNFFGVDGQSEIISGLGGRTIQIPMWIHDAGRFDTAKKLADYIEYELNFRLSGTHGDLQIDTDADHPPYLDVTFEGCQLLREPGIIKDISETLGGKYIAPVILVFRQLS